MKTNNNTESKRAKTSTDISKAKSKDGGRITKTLKWFCITANCNLSVTGDFDLPAADKEEAERKAREILDEFQFTLSARHLGGPRVSMHLHPENVDTEVVEISESSGPPDFTGTDAMLNRKQIEAEIGASVLGLMENLSNSEKGWRDNRENIHAGMRDEMEHDLFEHLWDLYLEVHPEQAVKEE